MSALPRNTILSGDALRLLQSLPTGLVDCVLTSPPYFRLRDYGMPGQLGTESHIEQWVNELRAVLRECARVLVPSGVVWLNLGDSYATHLREGAPRKSLLFGPERLALALIADGWTIRNKVVWHKINTVPTSVRDRLATKHEVTYLLTRSSSYFFDLDAIRQPHQTKPRRSGARSAPAIAARPDYLGPNADSDLGLAALHAAGLPGHPLGKNPGDVWSLSVSRYRGAHFATFPEHLVERLLRAGCPERRCSICRQPHRARLLRSPDNTRRLPLTPTCDCDAPSEPGLVLDPFLGAGTTAVAAEGLGRDWLGIELNPSFVDLSLQRLRTHRGTPMAA